MRDPLGKVCLLVQMLLVINAVCIVIMTMHLLK